MKKYIDPEILDVLPFYMGAKLLITYGDGSTNKMIYSSHFESMIFGTDLNTEEDIEIDYKLCQKW